MDTAELTSPALPDWAKNMVDLHVHASPSLLPRHGNDAQTVAAERALGFTTVVLKSHEGSTVERAAGLDEGVHVLTAVIAVPDGIQLASIEPTQVAVVLRR